MNNQDPNSMDMEKRVFLVLMLSMLILLGVPYIYRQIYPAPPASQAPAVARPKPAAVRPEAEAPPQAARTTPVAATSAKPESVEIENDKLILRWSNRGVTLESALLKDMGAAGEKRTALELIPQSLPATLPRPFQLRLEDEDVDSIVSGAFYAVDTGGRQGRLRAPAEVTFRYSGSGIEAWRKIRVPASGYAIEVEVEVRESGRSLPYSVFLGPGIGASGYEVQGDFSNEQIVFESGGSVERYQKKHLDGGPQRLELSSRWVAMDSHYFSYLLMADGPKKLTLKKSDLFRNNAKAQKERVPLLSAQVGLGRAPSFRAVFAPKGLETLRQIDPGLTRLIDYGWFSLIVKPLLYALKAVYGWVGNYGWAIIILTFLINLALFPVRYKQMVSMKKMSALQPKIKSIQDKYKRLKKDDPRRQEMNAEVMAVYREHGVNPLGGCLPLLVQMPFLFAFYQMLAASFELRGAHFIWWLKDLSKPDPYYITPIVMGATWLIQTKITPGGAGTDPMQRRMMMMMPVVFTFFFLSASSGLAVYFLFSNLFGMMFQLVIQKLNPELMKPAVAGGAKKR